MKYLYNQIKDLYYDKDFGIRKRMVFSSFCIIMGLGIIVWFLVRLLIYEGHWNTIRNINLPIAGQIGDFVGGLAGTFFTLVGVLLLFETLALQRRELKESRRVFEKQMFETTFFNLINLYQEVVRSLHFDYIESYGEKIYNGKDFFEIQRRKFYDEFQCQSMFGKNRKAAKIKYIEFYTSTKEQTSHYFRTLYRIFRFIHTSRFTASEKMHYAKIVRAQLSESELFFIHYNAYSEYGSKFRELINEFNILKHLPHLEKVEYKDYAGKLEQMERNSVGLVLEDLNILIKKSLLTGKFAHKTYLTGAIDFKVTSENNFSFTITITKRDDLSFTPTYQQGFGLTNFDLQKTETFIIDYLNDLISYSNYYEFNGRHVVISSSSNSNPTNGKHKINISVSNRLSNPIKFN